MNSTQTTPSAGRSPNLAQEIPRRKFVPALLPLVLGAAALVLYLFTLNHWVTFRSLPIAAQMSGYEWKAPLTDPLYWLVTLPIRALPENWIPLALNLFSAICASLTIALLARSVALLPHDRTEDQRMRERGAFSLLSIRLAWLPPVVAALVCGLQLSFWEHATSASKDIFNLLLFAYVIRCLLEFRIDGRTSWMIRSSFIFGAAMTNDWGMIGFFPVFLAALIWVMGLAFFNVRFLSRMFLAGVAGLAIYLVLPIANAVLFPEQISFWQTLKYGLMTQKQFLSIFLLNKYLLFAGDSPLWVLALPSLLPVFALALRWPSYFGDTSKLGVALTKLIFYVFSGVLLGVCLWVSLDPQLSPRKLLGYFPGLSLYYLGALSVGYFVGYFLLIFGVKPAGRFARSVPPWFTTIGKPIVALVILAGILMPIAAIYRNLPHIRLSNGPLLGHFTASLLANIPAVASRAGGAATPWSTANQTVPAVVVSDDLSILFLAESATKRANPANKTLFLSSQGLVNPQYHRHLIKRYGSRWPAKPPEDLTRKVDEYPLLRLMVTLSASNAVYYLHPSFGYYFEVFYPEPHGPVYELKQYPSDNHLKPPLSKDLLAQNEEYWRGGIRSTVDLVKDRANPQTPRNPNLAEKFLLKLRLRPEPNYEAKVLADFYSRALNFWGVALQDSMASESLANVGERLDLAATHFRDAIALNPDNVVAQANLECNRNVRTGKAALVATGKSATERFGKERTWDQVMVLHGPFDDPSICLEEGFVFAGNGNSRQAAQQFERVLQMDPNNLRARLGLAQVLAGQLRAPAEALKVVSSIKANAGFSTLEKNALADLLLVEAGAYLAQTNLARAEATINEALNRSGRTDTMMLSTASQVYIDRGYYSNAVPLLEQHLKIAPDDQPALVDAGYVWLQLKEFDKAVAPLTRALSLNPSNTIALYNRAVANLSAGHWDAAFQDYQALDRMYPNSYQIAFGFGEIAYNKHDTNLAVRHYESYLANAPTNTVDAEKVRTKLKELRPGAS